MNEYAGTLTLFDADDLVGSLMSATGADSFNARFMVALYRGEIVGDAEWIHPPGDEDVMFPELTNPHLVDIQLTPDSASYRDDGATVLIRITAES
jgi:hypothetical protein